MNPRRIIKSLWPVLAIEFCIVGFDWLAKPEAPYIVYVLLFVSIALLPFIVGLRLRSAGLSVSKCVVWGPSISVISLLWATASALIGYTTWGELLAFIAVSMFMSVVPQLAFSFLGAKYGHTLFSTAP